MISLNFGFLELMLVGWSRPAGTMVELPRVTVLGACYFRDKLWTTHFIHACLVTVLSFQKMVYEKPYF